MPKSLRTLVVGITIGIIALHGRGVRAQSVVILAADSLTATSRTISGAKAIVSAEHPDIRFVQATLSDDPIIRAKQLDSLRSVNPMVVMAVGSSATQLAKQTFPQTPVVFSSVMYPVMSGFVRSMNAPGGNVTGASLTISPEIQFKYFKRIIPGLKTIGVLYSPTTASLIPASVVVANDLGFQLVALEVSGDRDLPAALDSLTHCCDGIWSLADPIVFSPQATRFILLNTLKSGKPFMGFSRNVVESGALFALDFDYKAIGRQAGTQMNQILSGTKPSDIPVTSPDIIWFHYNEKTAQHLGISIPNELRAVAKEVYR